MDKPNLVYVRNWAKQEHDRDDTPPWLWYRYMQLIEACEHLIDEKKMTIPLRMVDDEAINH